MNRRSVLRWSAAALASKATALLPSPLAVAQKLAVAQPDWSMLMVESNLKRNPDPAHFGVWGYPYGLFLMGQLIVYRRTKDKRLLDYAVGFVDSHIDSNGKLDQPIKTLDNVLCANLLVRLFEETRQAKYKLAADAFRHRFDKYPRTTDGGFWHADNGQRDWQLWLDGNYMAVPFLVRYGRAFGDSTYTNAEAVRQLLVYHNHLKSGRMGLLYHAYDESGKASWADPVTHRSAYFWCRALGWYGMAIVDTLDVIPHNQPGRAELITILRELAVGLAHFQDPQTGLWYEVIDKPELAGNWTETSSSSMFTYIFDVGMKRGYLSKKYWPVAQKGYRGVLSRISLGSDGLTSLEGICIGTDVGDLAWYLARPRATNDFHGLGAFLLMNEEWHTSVASMT
jgi:unsaturated rhamnogalacturonyl hydrolase